MKVEKITGYLLDMMMESSKDAHPREFAAMLRAKDDTIVELILVPGTISGDSHAILQMHMLPLDFSIVGTVHSHPSPVPRPSEADLEFFRSRGEVHIIIAYPYDRTSYRVFDRNGNETELEVVS